MFGSNNELYAYILELIEYHKSRGNFSCASNLDSALRVGGTAGEVLGEIMIELIAQQNAKVLIGTPYESSVAELIPILRAAVNS